MPTKFHTLVVGVFFFQFQFEQECIPVGCVPSTTVAITRGCVSQGVRVIPWKVLGPGDDNSESINTLKFYCPY